MLNDTLYNLLGSVGDGNEMSFTALFHLYKQQVYAYAMQLTHSTVSSEEIVQDIFLKLWLNKERLKELDCFEAYLHTITRNLCFDYLKKLAHEESIKREWSRTVQSSEDSTESTFTYNHYESLVHQALVQLPPRQKEIFTLFLYKGQKQEEIAKYLHISRNTVKVHLAKARAAIRNYMFTHLKDIFLLLAIPLLQLFR